MADARSEFRQNWRALAGCFLGIAGGFSTLYFYSVGLFLTPLAAEFGWTRAEASLQAVAVAAANVVAIPLAGRLVDRLGAKSLAVASLLALSAGFVAMGTLVSGLTSFLIVSALVTAASAPSNPVTFNRIIVARFHTSRGLALGLALTAIGLGATLLPVLLGPVIAAAGWRHGYFVLAVAVLPFLAAMMFMLRELEDRPARQGAMEPLRTIIFQRRFATIALLIFLIAVPVLGTVVHLIPMLTDRGMDAREAGAIASAFGIAVIGGRAITGRLLDVLDAGILTAVILLLSATGMLLLSLGHPALLALGALLAGFGLGCESDLIAFLVSRRFALRSFGTVYGCVFSAHVVGAGIGPVIAGRMFDINGDYRAWLLFAAGSLVAAAGVALATERGRVASPDGQDAQPVAARV